MHDFSELMGPRRKDDPRAHEIVNELAGHLEEMYLDLLRAGVPEDRALALVSAKGKKLGPTVRRLRWQREGGLRTWLRAVVLPGLVLSLLYEAGHGLAIDLWQQPFLWREAGTVLVAIALGFCASSLSRELGGNESQRRWAGMFVISLPVAAWCIGALVFTPMELMQNTPRPGTISGVAVSLLWSLLWDALFPALGVTLGAAMSVLAFSPTSSDLRRAKIA